VEVAVRRRAGCLVEVAVRRRAGCLVEVAVRRRARDLVEVGVRRRARDLEEAAVRDRGRGLEEAAVRSRARVWRRRRRSVAVLMIWRRLVRLASDRMHIMLCPRLSGLVLQPADIVGLDV